MIIGEKVIYLESISSTNLYLKELSQKLDIKHGTIVCSKIQTSGRGQGDNTWFSEKEGGLTFSLLMKPDISLDLIFVLNKLIAISICNFLYSFNIHAKIKWPNDIYVGHKKIAGILIENSFNNKVYQSIVGIGLNVNQVVFPTSLPNPISMKMIKGDNFDFKKLLEKLCVEIQKKYTDFEIGSYKLINDQFNDFLFGKDCLCKFERNGDVFDGLIKGVDENGMLIVQEKNKLSKNRIGELKLIL